jgi:heat shock protein HtpX
MNIFKTAFLMTLLTTLVVFVGYLLGGTQGMIIAFALAFVMNFFSYWWSDKIVLMMYRAREVSRDEAPELYKVISELTRKADMPMPRVYIVPSESPNAFATGRNPKHAAVAVTDGILHLLNLDELRAVLAHELAHVKHRDILTATIVATMAGAIMILAQIAQVFLIFGGGRDNDEGGNPFVLLVVAIFAPFAAMLIQLAISRSREYHADAGGAQLSGDPLALANALRKLHSYSRLRPLAGASPSTAHMFIVNPLTAKGLMTLFSTHPAVEDRIAKLEAMAR